jgi:hypothetical protein
MFLNTRQGYTVVVLYLTRSQAKLDVNGLGHYPLRECKVLFKTPTKILLKSGLKMFYVKPLI